MSHPWMPFFFGDYLADTTTLTTVEHGAYFLLIAHYWQRGSLPQTDKELARIVRLPLKQWLSIRPQIAPYFDANWRHKRIEREIENVTQKVARKAAAGRLGGMAKAARSASKCYAGATAKSWQEPTIHHNHSAPHSGHEGKNVWVGGESSPTVVQGEAVGGRAIHEDAQPATAQIIPLSTTLRDGVERRQAAGPTAMAVKSPAEARGRHSQSSGLTDSGGAESAAGGTSEEILSDAPVAADGGAA